MECAQFSCCGINHASTVLLARLRATNMKGVAGYEPCVVLDMQNSDWDSSAIAVWRSMRFVALRLKSSKFQLDDVLATFLQNLKYIQKPGPSARCGLRSAGGWPHSLACLKMRTLAGVERAREVIAKEEGAWCDELSHFPTFEPMALSLAGDNFQGLNAHVDTDVVSGAPDVSFVQGLVTLWAPDSSVFNKLTEFGSVERLGAFLSILPGTPELLREARIAAASRYSQTESGVVGRGVHSQAAPSNHLGGDFLRLSDADALSDKDLVAHVHNHCDAYLAKSIPKDPDVKTLQKAEESLLKKLSDVVGTPVKSEQSLIRARTSGADTRDLLIRGLCGKVSSAALWRVFPDAKVNIAQSVFKMARKHLNASLMLAWHANKGRGRRTGPAVLVQPEANARQKKVNL